VTRPIHERLEAVKLWRAGNSGKRIARLSGIPRSTVRYWIRRFAGVAQAAEATGLKPVQWGFESLHQHQHPAYAYLLGLYLGDGCISRVPRTYVLRIFLNDGQPHVIAEAARAISQLAPKRVGLSRIGRRVVVVRMYWGGWPLMLPQHGHPLRRLPASTHRQGQELSGVRILQPLGGHPQPLRLVVSPARYPVYTIEPSRHVGRSAA
jgi:Homeodomain-like domain